ncbi:MAG: 30S ribosomal protein S13 [Nanoarchaeota archaeon]|nr:30S ribosomal protein S13 [Nanoarchaeota archaeon]
MAENKPKVENPDYRHLVRIANADIDGKRPVLYGLAKVKGISVMYANAACYAAGIDKKRRIGELSDAEVKALEEVLLNPSKFNLPNWILNRRKDPETGEDKHIMTADLMFAKDMDVKMMKKIKSFKGMRHQWGLPVRGQRTKSNFRRNKGKGLGVKRKKTKGSGK